MTDSGKVADAPSNSWVYRVLHSWIWPYAQLARWDRPIGWQLLVWPCWLGLVLVLHFLPEEESFFSFWHMFLFLVGAIAMRGAGCTYNDIVDRHLDASVERTKSRPLPAGRINVKQAIGFLLLQGLVGFIVLIQFNSFAILLGLCSLAIVVIYPFMKRVTYWPQFVLGLAFSWGAFMAFAAQLEQLPLSAVALYVGCVTWTIGYDTIYALQDIEDDELIGVKSTARFFGDNVKQWLTGFYAITILTFGIATYLAGAAWPAYIGLALTAAHLGRQIYQLQADDGAKCLELFKSNAIAPWCFFIGLLLASFIG